MPPVFEMIPVQLLGIRGLATRQVRLLLYSSERSNTRATHIQCCPREPQALAADHPRNRANRVRSATASGSVGAIDTSITVSEQMDPGQLFAAENAIKLRTNI